MGVAEDIPLLRRVAQTDPFQREVHGLANGAPGTVMGYPVRQAAESAIRQIERRQAEQNASENDNSQPEPSAAK
jgi:hypothetical protein